MSDMKHKNDQSGGPVTEDLSVTPSSWDHSSHDQFYDHYARGSLSPQTMQRLRAIRKMVLEIHDRDEKNPRPCEVADIGCGAGTQSLFWAELGHRVHGIDVNAPLVELAKERAASAGYSVDYHVGTALQLPWLDESIDICLAAELLEHVKDWEACLTELTRILRPGGVLFLTTSNKLCPVQQEFNLPAYSWYPALLKRHFERLATTTRPQLANYATYPAVNWFSFYSLQEWLASRGFQCEDRFDVMDMTEKGILARCLIGLIRAVPLLRFMAHVCTPGTTIVGLRRSVAAVH